MLRAFSYELTGPAACGPVLLRQELVVWVWRYITTATDDNHFDRSLTHVTDSTFNATGRIFCSPFDRISVVIGVTPMLVFCSVPAEEETCLTTGTPKR